jgi:hypothetical protein
MVLHRKRKRNGSYVTPPPIEGTYKRKIEIGWEGPRNNIGKIWCPLRWNSLYKRWAITKCYSCRYSVARTTTHLYCNFMGKHYEPSMVEA